MSCANFSLTSCACAGLDKSGFGVSEEPHSHDANAARGLALTHTSGPHDLVRPAHVFHIQVSTCCSLFCTNPEGVDQSHQVPAAVDGSGTLDAQDRRCSTLPHPLRDPVGGLVRSHQLTLGTGLARCSDILTFLLPTEAPSRCCCLNSARLEFGKSGRTTVSKSPLEQIGELRRGQRQRVLTEVSKVLLWDAVGPLTCCGRHSSERADRG